jgi:hypothetical protein
MNINHLEDISKIDVYTKWGDVKLNKAESDDIQIKMSGNISEDIRKAIISN